MYQGLYNKTNLDIEWTKINGISLNSIASTVTGSLNIKLALHNPTGPNDPSVLYAGIIGSNKQLSNVFFTTDQGTTWQPVGTTVPAVNTTPDGANAQGDMNFSIAADPKMSNLVYIGGDRQANPPYVGNLYVGNTSNPGSAWTSIVLAGANNTAPHSDTRSLVFTSNGLTLLESDDGGIYSLSSPRNPATRTWSSLDGNLQITEMYSVAYDPINKILLARPRTRAPRYRRSPTLRPGSSFSPVTATSSQPR